MYYAGVPPKPIQSCVEHDYTVKTSAGQNSLISARAGFTTLTTKGCGDDQVALQLDLGEGQSTPDQEVKAGHSVHLLSSSYQRVGTAVTMSGRQLHGHPIPEGFCKVVIGALEQIRKPWPSVKGGHDEDLVNGSITAWPLKFMRKVT